MAEKRMIHSNFFEDDYMGSMSPVNRLLWLGIICTCADDQGRLAHIPAVVRSKVFPYDDIKLADIAAAIDQLAADGKLRAYVASGRPLLQVVHWWRYQQPAWAEPSAYPAPEGWTDRVRWHARGGAGVQVQNWDHPGGFEIPNAAPAVEVPTPQLTPQPTPLRRPLRSPLRSRLLTPQRTPEGRGIVIDELSREIDELSQVKQQKQEAELSTAPVDKQAAPAIPAAAAAQELGIYPKSPKEARKNPDIALFERVAGKHPGIKQYPLIVDTIELLRAEMPESELEGYLRRFAGAWRARTSEKGRPYDILHLAWLTEWAVNDEIPEERARAMAPVEPDRNRYILGEYADFVEH